MRTSRRTLAAGYVLGGMTLSLASLTASLSAQDARSGSDLAPGQQVAQQSLPELASNMIVSGLSFPTFVTHAPGDESRLFILEKPGRIRIFDLDSGTLLPTPFLDITATVTGGTSEFDERGLLGLAFHPDYDNNGFFYVYFTTGGSNLAIIVRRYSVSDTNPNVANPSGFLNLLLAGQPQNNHNGGWIGFGPDGYLYIATGDGGGSGDPGNNGQNPNNLLGSMLRIDVDNQDPGLNYAIPDSNPFKGVSGFRDETWAYGLRNPWRCSFDRIAGDLWIADVGQNAWEEINLQKANDDGGQNYGWRCYEGFQPFNTNNCPPAGQLTFPIFAYQNTGFFGSIGCSITGGYVYRGCDIPGLQGMYIFGDFCPPNRIWAIDPDSPHLPYNPSQGGTNPAIELTSQLSPSVNGFPITRNASFGEDARGEMYIVRHNPGQIFKIIPADPDPQPNPDLNCDGVVNVADLLILFDNWGDCPDPDNCPADLNGDGVVNVADLLILFDNWG
jgi:glucose/arabinose dehydrogenase